MFIWASWLPSCWNEMEYLRRAYAKYGNRGLKIVAANVYDKRSDFDYIYDSERFPWSMVYVEDGKAATALYGIRSIPYIMLFDSNGVVVSRGLREEQIEDLLSSIRLK